MEHNGIFGPNLTVCVFNAKDYFLFDLASLQSCAGNQPLLIDKNSYGGLAVRRYLYIPIGKPDTAKIEILWRDYAESPRVTARLAA